MSCCFLDLTSRFNTSQRTKPINKQQQQNMATSAGFGKFASAEHAALFNEGLTLMFQRWTALQLVVDHQMGGIDTIEMAQMLQKHTYDFFLNHGLNVEPHELDENYIGYFEECFNADLEDGSGMQIANAAVGLFKELGQGSMESLNKLRELAAKGRPAGAAMATRVRGDDDEDDSSDDDSDDFPMDGDDIAEASRMQADEPAAAPAPKPDPIVDEDGFELVQKPRRRR
jgi:pre-rRNA-processing protein TSR2